MNRAERAMDVPLNETVLRLGCFAGVFLLMALWETLAPRRHLSAAKSLRWLSNLGLVLLGPPALGVLVFEVLLNATSMFNHGNVRFPALLDRVLRWIVVTPEMHRVHHSINPAETNSNFGFNMPWWDYFFGTYRAQPAE